MKGWRVSSKAQQASYLNLALSAASNARELWEALDVVVDETNGKYPLPESSVRCVLDKLAIGWPEVDQIQVIQAAQALLLDFRELLQTPTRTRVGQSIDTPAQRAFRDYVGVVENLTASKTRDMRCAAKYVLACWEMSTEKQLPLLHNGIDTGAEPVERATSLLTSAVIASRLKYRATWLPRILGADFWGTGETDRLVSATAVASEALLTDRLRPGASDSAINALKRPVSVPETWWWPETADNTAMMMLCVLTYARVPEGKAKGIARAIVELGDSPYSPSPEFLGQAVFQVAFGRKKIPESDTGLDEWQLGILERFTRAPLSQAPKSLKEMGFPSQNDLSQYLRAQNTNCF